MTCGTTTKRLQLTDPPRNPGNFRVEVNKVVLVIDFIADGEAAVIEDRAVLSIHLRSAGARVALRLVDRVSKGEW